MCSPSHHTPCLAHGVLSLCTWGSRTSCQPESKGTSPRISDEDLLSQTHPENLQPKKPWRETFWGPWKTTRNVGRRWEWSNTLGLVSLQGVLSSVWEGVRLLQSPPSRPTLGKQPASQDGHSHSDRNHSPGGSGYRPSSTGPLLKFWKKHHCFQDQESGCKAWPQAHFASGPEADVCPGLGP